MDRLPSGDDYSVMSTGSNGRWFLKKTNKLKRLEEFYRLNWPVPPEDVGDTEFSMLRKEWEPLLTSDIAAVLFGPSSLTGKSPQYRRYNMAMALALLCRMGRLCSDGLTATKAFPIATIY